MREVLVKVAKRLGELPATCGELVGKRAEVSDALHQYLDAVEEFEVKVAGMVASEKADGKPVYPNEAARNAEITKRLQNDEGYKGAIAQTEKLRQELRETDARIEEAGRRHRSDANMVNLIASLLNAGMKDDAEAVLQAYAPSEAPDTAPAPVVATPAPEAATPAPPVSETKQGVDTGIKAAMADTAVFTVMEVRPGKSDGTIRAFVEGPEGKVALFAKNGAGTALAAAVGKKVEAKFRKLEHGLYATEIKPVA